VLGQTETECTCQIRYTEEKYWSDIYIKLKFFTNTDILDIFSNHLHENKEALQKIKFLFGVGQTVDRYFWVLDEHGQT